MPTLNEEARIERALKSIREQSVDQTQVEIIVIDGGSIDNTQKIALKYGAIIFDNNKIVPEEAKKIGISNSKGRYVVFMDADEEFTHEKQLSKRLELFQINESVKLIIPNILKTPEGYPKITEYINSYKDPFTAFVYRLNGESVVNRLQKYKYSFIYAEDQKIMFLLKDKNITIIADAGTTMFDLEYIKNQSIDIFYQPDFTSIISEEILKQTKCFGVIEDDVINHFTSTQLKIYLKKLKWRVINNLYPNNYISGYTARTRVNKALKVKKYLFLGYCLLPPLVLLDSIRIAIRERNLVFLLHFIFTYFIVYQTFKYSILKLFKVKVINKAYGR
jgi:glycosyltransferase involved in cell wall biosynthesis